MENKYKCENCRKELNVGVDAIKVIAGVIGVKDFVPLGEPMLFCSDKCIEEYYDLDALPSVPSRMP